MLRIKYHPADDKYPLDSVVYMVLTPDTYFLTQFDMRNGEWKKVFNWTAEAKPWEVDEPFIYDFIRNPHF